MHMSVSVQEWMCTSSKCVCVQALCYLSHSVMELLHVPTVEGKRRTEGELHYSQRAFFGRCVDVLTERESLYLQECEEERRERESMPDSGKVLSFKA